jgi:hypothetical protein
MKKIFILLLSSFIFLSETKAQLCTDIPIAFSSDSIYFTSSDGFGDSMFVFTMLNEHPTQGFAYPQAKLEPVTPLPSGMSLNSINDPWAVFASSWNPGQYSPVHIYYDVDEAIPEDYTVTFKLWINNLAPVTDSCFFDDIITINLNPSEITGLNNMGNSAISIYPNPVLNGQFTISENTGNNHLWFSIFDLSGKTLKQGSIYKNEIISTTELSSGVYFIQIKSGETFQTQKLVIE